MRLLLFFALILGPSLSSALTPMNFQGKAITKEQHRWTLKEWLEQKDTVKLMNLWLAMNSASPYEFFIGGHYNTFTSNFLQPGTEQPLWTSSVAAGAYASILGIELGYERNPGDQTTDGGATLNLRLFGNAVQATHIIIFYGFRNRIMTDSNSTIEFYQPLAGIDLSLHLNKFFGLFGVAKSYIPIDESTLGEVTGSYTNMGMFIDFAFVRITGGAFSEVQNSTLSGVTTARKKQGFSSGLAFFF